MFGLGFFLGCMITFTVIDYLGFSLRGTGITPQEMSFLKVGGSIRPTLRAKYEGSHLLVEKNLRGSGTVWYFWDFGLGNMIRARMQGAYPFTVYLDGTGTIAKLGYEYNSRFD